MSTEATLGMNKRVPLETLQLAVEQELSGIDDFDRIDETIRAQFQGEARAVKGLKQVRSTVRNSPIHDFLMEHKDDLLTAMKNKADKKEPFFKAETTVKPDEATEETKVEE